MKNSTIFKIMFFLCVVVILYLATTTQEIKPLEHTWDKANHFIAFITLYILLSLAYQSLNIKIKALILIGYGIFIEIVQYFIPGRDFSGLDVVADSIGIVIGVILFMLYQKQVLRKES